MSLFFFPTAVTDFVVWLKTIKIYGIHAGELLWSPEIHRTSTELKAIQYGNSTCQNVDKQADVQQVNGSVGVGIRFRLIIA